MIIRSNNKAFLKASFWNNLHRLFSRSKGPSSAIVIWILIFTCGSKLVIISILRLLLDHFVFHVGGGHALVLW